jgi:hypothetical protein
VPYQLLPKGFLDDKNIQEARRTMSTLAFMMEYEAVMTSDSDGFFKASLLEQCTAGSDFSIRLTGDASRDYIMGIDPSQGGAASCGIVIIELNNPHRIVLVNELKKKSLQETVVSIQKLTNIFKVKHIYMDSQGGGKSIKDLLQEGYNNQEPILDIEDELNIGKSGRRILHMVNPTPAWISDANFDLLALLDNRNLKFPGLPLSSDPIAEKLYEEIRVLKAQLLNIIITQTPRGVTHFDTPRKGQNKDLYSALVLAGWGVREMERSTIIPETQLSANGYLRTHQPGAKFVQIGGSAGKEYIKAAVLKKNN